MTTEPQEGRLDDGLTVLRRIRDYEVFEDDEGNRRPSSQAFIQGGPDGNVSVYLASETTPEQITRHYPGTHVAEVEISSIRAQGLDVERDPIEGDPGTATSPAARPGPEQERLPETPDGQQSPGLSSFHFHPQTKHTTFQGQSPSTSEPATSDSAPQHSPLFPHQHRSRNASPIMTGSWSGTRTTPP